MTKKSPSQLEAHRAKKRAEEVAKAMSSRRVLRLDEQWYELVSYFDPEKIQSFDIRQTQGYRTFIHGMIEDMTVVEVESTMPREKVVEYGRELGAMGINALIVSDNVRFVKLRSCSVEECELLNAKDTEKKGQVFAANPRPGPEPDGDGGSSPDTGDDGAAPGGDQDNTEDADVGAPAEDSQPSP